MSAAPNRRYPKRFSANLQQRPISGRMLTLQFPSTGCKFSKADATFVDKRTGIPIQDIPGAIATFFYSREVTMKRTPTQGTVNRIPS